MKDESYEIDSGQLKNICLEAEDIIAKNINNIDTQ